MSPKTNKRIEERAQRDALDASYMRATDRYKGELKHTVLNWLYDDFLEDLNDLSGRDFEVFALMVLNPVRMLPNAKLSELLKEHYDLSYDDAYMQVNNTFKRMTRDIQADYTGLQYTMGGRLKGISRLLASKNSARPDVVHAASAAVDVNTDLSEEYYTQSFAVPAVGSKRDKFNLAAKCPLSAVAFRAFAIVDCYPDEGEYAYDFKSMLRAADDKMILKDLVLNRNAAALAIKDAVDANPGHFDDAERDIADSLVDTVTMHGLANG